MQQNRIAYIDQVKVLLTCLVVAHHAAQAYGPTGGIWVVNDSAKAGWLRDFFFINASFMMGLYFFISGYFLEFSIAKKTTSQFIKERLKRLGIPLLFFTFLVFLPFNYLITGSNESIVCFFIKSYFHNPPIATGHLWFVASLLIYSFIYLIFRFRKSKKHHETTRRFYVTYIWGYIILLTIVSAIVRLRYPIDLWKTWIIPVEVAHLPQYLSLFLSGTLFNRNKWLDHIKIKDGLIFLLSAFIGFLATKMLPSSITDFWITESLIESILCVGLSIFLLTFFRLYVNRMNRLTSWISYNAYGIYLFHLFIVIWLQKFLLTLKIDANVKFIFVSIGGILLSMALSSLLKRNSFIRNIL